MTAGRAGGLREAPERGQDDWGIGNDEYRTRNGSKSLMSKVQRSTLRSNWEIFREIILFSFNVLDLEH